MGGLIRQHRLFGDRIVRAAPFDKAQAHPAHQLCLGHAALFLIAVHLWQYRQCVRLKIQCVQPVTQAKDQRAIALHRVKPVAQHQRLQSTTRLRHVIDRIGAHNTPELACVDLRHTRLPADLRHHRGQRALPRAPVEPVPTRVILAIVPDLPPVGKGGKGSRIPGPDIGVAQVHHRTAIGAGGRVVRALLPVGQLRAQIFLLDEIVA